MKRDLLERIGDALEEDSGVKTLDAILDMIAQGQKKLDTFVRTQVNTRTPEQKKYKDTLKALSDQIRTSLGDIEKAREKYE